MIATALRIPVTLAMAVFLRIDIILVVHQIHGSGMFWFYAD